MYIYNCKELLNYLSIRMNLAFLNADQSFTNDEYERHIGAYNELEDIITCLSAENILEDCICYLKERCSYYYTCYSEAFTNTDYNNKIGAYNELDDILCEIKL